MLTCLQCDQYDNTKKSNNCKSNIIGTIRDNQSSACYKIQFHVKKG